MGNDLFYEISFSTDLTTIIKEFQQFWRSIDYQKLIINTQVDEELKQLVKTTIYITNKVYNSVMDNLKENKILEKLHEFESSKKYEIIRAPFENKKNN